MTWGNYVPRPSVRPSGSRQRQNVVDLPYDLGQPRSGGTAGRVVQLPMPEDLNEAVEQTARRSGVTVTTVFLAAYATVLEAIADVTDILISLPVTRRRTADEHRVIGYLVHSVPVRVRLGSCQTAGELIGHCAEALRAALLDADVSFGQIVKEVRPKRQPGLNPLCQCEFSVQSIPARLPKLGGSELRYQFIHNGGHKFSLGLEVVSSGGRRSIAVEYPADLFLSATASRIARLFLRVLRHLAAGQPDLPPDKIGLLAPSEEAWLADRGGSACRAAPPTLATRIEQSIRAHPMAPAVIDSDRELTYRELGNWADEVMAAWRAAGIQPGDRIALLGGRGRHFVVAVIAAVRLGVSFIPLADDTPAHRVAQILSAAEPAAVLVTSEALLPALPARVRSAAVPCPVGWLAMASWEKDPAAGRRGPRPGRLGEAYVVFTSGSTGPPRGVAVPATSLAAVTAGWGQVFGLPSRPGRHLQLAPFSFDVFVGDLARSLGFGGALVLAERDQILAPAQLVDLIARQRADTAEFVPAVATLIADYLGSTGARLTGLERVMVGSDSWPVDEARRLCRVLPAGTQIYCTYGTTETTIDSTYYRVDADALPSRGTVPIGLPFPGTLVSVRDRRGRMLPPGLSGELWVSGDALSDGYLTAQPETAVPGPFVVTPGPQGLTRWYRTGDRVVWGRSGVLSLLGRLDTEVKVGGVRVQPVEVERMLSGHPAVRAVAVVASSGEASPRQLGAFIVGTTAADLDDIRRYASTRLLAAAVPSVWRLVERLPLTRHGKVDRDSLARAMASVPGPAVPSADDTSLEATVLQIWRGVLGQPDLGPLDDFFDVGGSSIQAAQLAWRISAQTGQRADVGDILAHPSPRALCQALMVRPADGGEAAGRDQMFTEASPLTRREMPSAPFADSSRRHPARPGPPRRVVLTGSTGTLGPGLLRELLATPVTSLICLIRAATADQARERLRVALARYGADPALADDRRLVACPADLTAPDAGLSAADLRGALRADAIVNAAAWVNFVYPYRLLAPVNVGGLVTLGGMARQVRAKVLHHLSTRSIVSAGRPDGGYNSSKAAAEEVLNGLAASGQQTCLYRPGFVLGRLAGRRDGAGLLECFLRECVRLGSAPTLPGHLDVVSADYVARSIVTNVMSAQPAAHVELAGATPLPWMTAWAMLGDLGAPLDLVPAAEWLGRVSESPPGASWFEPFLPLCAAIPLEELFDDPPVPPGPGAEPVAAVWRHVCTQLMATGPVP